MLSNDTKKVIDDARDTLVGQIPVPMMQCQQITLALTYKFMSDDDEQAVELGGQRHYFTGGLEKYGWDKIMSLRLDDTQRSELYRAGLSALQVSNSLPAVFHEIFKDAMVPYGDHRTLALFLNTMNGMGYDDSEKLGEAYEYLLKTAEAQADAGQFRTPRHIIDFIVNIIDPQKHEVIIDPACGTAGFLVSAYQHVKSQHELPGGGTTLSIPDLTRLSDNLNGYDISPEMTKLAMVNMYLHTQDKNPNIANYDTLTSTDHWNEYADVMLANPPFMTPKGGIRPHSRFRVAAKKAEVLFVDYIASHLNEHGRAGIIVPEGIIFQSQNAYRQLRRILAGRKPGGCRFAAWWRVQPLQRRQDVYPDTRQGAGAENGLRRVFQSGERWLRLGRTAPSHRDRTTCLSFRMKSAITSAVCVEGEIAWTVTQAADLGLHC